jgi:hypothetical protein
MARKMSKKHLFGTFGLVVGLVVLVGVLSIVMNTGSGMTCPHPLYSCPGVGCVSGPDKCIPFSQGGPSRVFSKETFKQWPGVGYTATPPEYKEHFVNKKCPDGSRSDGPCLMEFPTF